MDAIDCSAEGYYPDEPDSIIYKGLFPYLRIPEAQSDAATYVLLAVDMVNVNKSNPAFCDIQLTLWAMSHRSLMQMKGISATRIDYIGEELSKLLDGQLKYGYGKLELTASREVILSATYIYRELIFRTVDMRASSHNKLGSFK